MDKIKATIKEIEKIYDIEKEKPKEKEKIKSDVDILIEEEDEKLSEEFFENA